MDSNSDRGIRDRLKVHFQSKAVRGLIEIAPTLITVVVIAALVGYADQFVRPYTARLPALDIFGRSMRPDFPGVGIATGMAISYMVGLLMSSPPGASCMRQLDRLMLRIPFVKTVFGVSRQITSSMTAQYNFSRVVFIEWPRENIIAMGFVTGRAYSQRTGDSLAVVYVPTVPNPTSGNMAFVKEDNLIETDMTVENAMKLVFSGGISLPADFGLARVHAEVKSEAFNSYGGYTQSPPARRRPTRVSVDPQTAWSFGQTGARRRQHE